MRKSGYTMPQVKQQSPAPSPHSAGILSGAGAAMAGLDKSVRRPFPSSGSAIGGATDRTPSTGRMPISITKEVLLEAVEGNHRPRSETAEQFLGRQTHLKLQGRRLGPFFDKMALVPQVFVLYAYENVISSLQGLEALRRLQQLYLQHNRIAEMAGPALEALTNLKKLHLGYNRLTRIEGLQNCTCLEELHVPHQRLPAGYSLEFCPRSITSIAPTLRVLDVSGNHLQDAMALGPLKGLQTLDISDNEIREVEAVRPLLSSYLLTRIRVAGNPWALQERRYRYDIVLLARSVEEIDGKDVPAQEREFVRRLEEQRQKVAGAQQKGTGKGTLQRPMAQTVPMQAGGQLTGKGGLIPLAKRSSKGSVVRSAPSILQDNVH